MNTIAAELATLSDTIIAPIYSWVTPFQNFRQAGSEWDKVCGSSAIADLGFDEQMAAFVQVKIEGDCCQMYGICGEQYALDVIFNDEGRVEATRFRFQHQVQKTQEDYIKGLVETRKACDLYVDTLTTYPSDKNTPPPFSASIDVETDDSNSIFAQFNNFMGLNEPQVLKA